MKNERDNLIGRRVIDIICEFGRTGTVVESKVALDCGYIGVSFDGDKEDLISIYNRNELYFYDDRAMINPRFKKA